MGDPTTDNYIVTGGFFDPTGPICANGKAAGSATQQDAETGMLVTHSLRADGFDASEDRTGRGTPLVPVGYRVHGENSTAMASNGVARVADPVDTARSLDSCGGYATNQGGNVVLQPIAFSCKDSGLDSGETSPTLRSMNFDRSHANARSQVAVAFQERAICENPLAGPDGVGVRSDGLAYTVEARQVPQAVAFLHCNKGRPDGRKSTHTEMVTVENIVPTLSTDGHVQSAVAFNLRGREGDSQPEMTDQASLRSASGGSRSYVAGTQETARMNGGAGVMAVRRLTPC